jgi:hypothetical protein
MTFAAVQDIKGGDWETYEKIVAEVGVEGDAPAGLIVHVAGEVDGGTRIIDVWESEQAYEEFVTTRLRPASGRVLAGQERPASPPPQVMQVKHLLRP